MNNLKTCLRLARSENIGKSTFFRLIETFGSAQEALEKLEEGALTPNSKRQIKIFSNIEAEFELEKVKNFGGELLSFYDSRYPKLLREIPDPAPILTVKGSIEFFNRDIIAIVGPRNASFNATNFAKKIAAELGQNSIIISSGLARGVDAAAHEASISSGTIAVIGGGINHIYPKENERLFAAVSQRGLLVSESAFDAIPKGGNFIQRNRIISGISLAVIVIEAGLRSGSLTTARFAAEQGREVFAVPGSPLDPRCQGANRLIKDGAKMLESVNDVFDELPRLRKNFHNLGMLREAEIDDFAAPRIKMPPEDEITKIRHEILSRLSFAPIEVAEIISQLQIAPRLVNIALIQLELTDKIEFSRGKITLKNQNF